MIGEYPKGWIEERGYDRPPESRRLVPSGNPDGRAGEYFQLPSEPPHPCLLRFCRRGDTGISSLIVPHSDPGGLGGGGHKTQIPPKSNASVAQYGSLVRGFPRGPVSTLYTRHVFPNSVREIRLCISDAQTSLHDQVFRFAGDLLPTISAHVVVVCCLVRQPRGPKAASTWPSKKTSFAPDDHG